MVYMFYDSNSILHFFILCFIFFFSVLFSFICYAGNADGMGHTRKDELYRACAVLKVITNAYHKRLMILSNREVVDLKSACYYLEIK